MDIAAWKLSYGPHGTQAPSLTESTSSLHTDGKSANIPPNIRRLKILAIGTQLTEPEDYDDLYLM